MTYKFGLTIICALGLSACQSTQDAATNSGFRTPNAAGFVSQGIVADQTIISLRNRDANGDGFAYASGKSTDEGFVAYAGVLPSTQVGSHSAEGTAVYDARYSLVQITGINLSGNRLTGSNTTDNGDITLNANFGAGTLTGSSGRLSVSGTFEAGNTLGGTVSWRGVNGSLRGLIGDDEVVGAFHGNNEDAIFAGGFNGDAR